MLNQVSSLARFLTEISVRRPLVTAVVGMLATAGLAFQAAQLTSEVGYAAYFGPSDPAVERLSSFFEEFDSGLHVLVVFGCPGSNVCSSIRDRSALEFIAKLQQDLDRLSNVRRTQSVLNAPILVGPLETRTIAERDAGLTSTPCRNPSLRSSMTVMVEKIAVKSRIITSAPGKKYSR